MKRKTKKRMMACLLVFAMVASLIMVPQKQAIAAEPSNVALEFDGTEHSATANAQNNVEVNLGNAGLTSVQAMQDAGVTELCVSFKITKLTASGDAGVQAFINAQDLWQGTWANVTASSAEQTVSLDLSQFYGTGAELYNFGFQICNVSSVTYQITDAYLVKGEAGAGSGTGTGSAGGSNIGTIDNSLDYNFAKLLQYSLYFYDGNMCGDGVNDKSLFSKTLYNGWRGNCHVHDSFTYGGKTYSAVGGYHDAGDHVKFGLPMAEAMSTLGIGYLEFKDAFVELKQDQHLKTIVDYYCDYVKSCTVTNANGDVEAFCYQVGHGQPDHQSWCAPEVENETQTDRKYTLIATASNPATDIVSESAAALAINYLNFGKESDLEYAKMLFAFATKNSKKNADGDDSGTFYAAGSWEDDYCLAAAMLYKATKDATYKTAYTQNNKNNGNIQKPYGWADVYQAAAFYAPERNNSEITTINSWFNGVVSQNQSRYYCADSWGSARYNCNVQLMMLIASHQQGGIEAYDNWAKYQMSIILGNNSLKKNLVMGYNEQSPKQPHHRAASGQNGWNDFHNASVVSKYTLYGALVGGPTTSDFSTYKDVMDDDHTSEVTLDYNAGLVGAAAALYLLNKDSKEEGFENQAINATFYGGKEFTNKGSSTEATTQKNTEATTQKNTEATTQKNTEATTQKNTEATTQKNTEATTQKNTEATTQKNTEATTQKNTEATTQKNTEATTQKNTEATTQKNTEVTTQKSEEQTSSEEKKSEEQTSSEDKKSEEQTSSEDKKSEEQTSSEDKKSEEQTSSEDKKSEEQTSSEDKKSEEQTSSEDKKSEEQTSSEDKKSEEQTSSEDKTSEEQTSSEDNTSSEEQKNSEDKKDEQPNTMDEDSVTAPVVITANVKNAKNVAVEESFQLAPKKTMTLKITDPSGKEVKEKITFKSSDENIATVDDKGKITAGKNTGTVTINVMTANGAKKTFTLKVMKKAITKLKVKCAKKTIKKGKTAKLRVVVSPKNVSKKVIWKTSNKKIATVNAKGKVKALKKGTVKITAIATDGSGKKATVKLKIK